MPESAKPIGVKSIHQEVLEARLKDGTLEIIFQIEVDSGGNAVITFFKDIKKLQVEIPKNDPLV